jgi:hypothetical protein
MNHPGLMRFAASLVLALLAASTGWAQQTAPAVNASPVPHLVSYSGTLKDGNGKPVIGITGVTFLLYRDAQGGAPVWMETQNVTPDSAGRYTAQLGATRNEGLRPETFMTGEARWLAVQAAGAPEQPRVLLVAVPYAMKAADAETVGGLPPSAFVLAAPSATSGAASPSSPNSTTGAASPSAPPPASNVTTTGGAANTIPMFTSSSNIQNSILTQTATSAITVGGKLVLPATGTASASKGFSSQPQTFVGSVFNSSTSTAVNQKFQWQAEPTNNDKATASSTLNLLYGSGTAAPAETGLKINPKGQITFALGQTFPGIGSGTVKSVGLSAPASDFIVSGSPITGSGTLGLSWTVAPSSGNSANAIVKRDANGAFAAGGITSTSATVGVVGQSSGTNAVSDGVDGLTSSATASGVAGINNSNSGGTGVYGVSPNGLGVFGSGATGVEGVSSSGEGVFASGSDGADGIIAEAPDGAYAGFFEGNVLVLGNLSKSGGSFKIDHPLDPAEKYLYHSFVESPDMMNIYNGNVTTDAQGDAIVTMPDWFEALNRDFRYQLTVIGTFAQAIVATEMANGSFSIRTDKPNVKVSWQVTGVRQDAWANSHRIPVEQVKPERERGSYLHPELFGAPAEKSIAWARHPETMKRAKERQPLPAPLQAPPISTKR